MLDEDQALSILQSHLSNSGRGRRAPGVAVGIGDDAAVLSRSKYRRVWTVDACNEGSHFLAGWLSPRELAHKSLHAAASDVCAMGAVAEFALCQLTLSSKVNATWLRKFAAAQARVTVVGGNVSFGETVQIATTVMGTLRAGGPLLQEGALPGDEVWVFGDLGLARAGLLLLQQGRGRLRGAAVRRCLRAFRQPDAQLQVGPRLCGRAHACLDVSDGLLADSGALARQSGVRIVLERGRVRSVLAPELLEVAALVGEDALEMALLGGEDYALLAAGPRDRRPRGARVIGRVEPGDGVYVA